MAGTTITTVTLVMNAGDSCVLEIPQTASNMGGYWPTQEDGYVNGFKLENSDVGEITEVSGKVAVNYNHKENADNVVVFKSLFGDTVRIVVGNIPVHDHASIRTGGPAYGSYFSDLKAAEQ